jgi:arylformamidase
MTAQSNELIRWTDGIERKIYDISVSLSSDTPVFPGQPRFDKRFILSLAKGERANVSGFSLTSHTGTHVDSPNHFIEDVDTIDKIPFKRVMGKAHVFEMNVAEKIDVPDIRPLKIEPKSIVLFKTRNSKLWAERIFRKDYVYLTKGAAEILRDNDVAAVGLDYIIPDEFENMERPVHHVLFGREIILIEGLNLDHVPPGDYFLICLPLKIKDGEAAPARAVLVEL